MAPVQNIDFDTNTSFSSNANVGSSSSSSSSSAYSTSVKSKNMEQNYRSRCDTSDYWEKFFPFTSKTFSPDDSFFESSRTRFDRKVKRLLDDWEDDDFETDLGFRRTGEHHRNFKSSFNNRPDVTCHQEKDQYKLMLDFSNIEIQEIKLKVVGKLDLLVEGRMKRDCKSFRYYLSLPDDANTTAISSSLSVDNLLTIVVPIMQNSSDATCLTKEKYICKKCEYNCQEADDGYIEVKKTSGRANINLETEEHIDLFRENKSQLNTKLNSRCYAVDREEQRNTEESENPDKRNILRNVLTEENNYSKHSNFSPFGECLKRNTNDIHSMSCTRDLDEHVHTSIKNFLSRRNHHSSKMHESEIHLQASNKEREIIKIAEENLYYLFAMDLQDFIPDENIDISFDGRRELTIKCQKMSENKSCSQSDESITEKFLIPEDSEVESIRASLISSEGLLVIFLPKKSQLTRNKERSIPITSFNEVENETELIEESKEAKKSLVEGYNVLKFATANTEIVPETYNTQAHSFPVCSKPNEVFTLNQLNMENQIADENLLKIRKEQNGYLEKKTELDEGRDICNGGNKSIPNSGGNEEHVESLKAEDKTEHDMCCNTTVETRDASISKMSEVSNIDCDKGFINRHEFTFNCEDIGRNNEENKDLCHGNINVNDLESFSSELHKHVQNGDEIERTVIEDASNSFNKIETPFSLGTKNLKTYVSEEIDTSSQENNSLKVQVGVHDNMTTYNSSSDSQIISLNASDKSFLMEDLHFEQFSLQIRTGIREVLRSENVDFSESDNEISRYIDTRTNNTLKGDGLNLSLEDENQYKFILDAQHVTDIQTIQVESVNGSEIKVNGQRSGESGDPFLKYSKCFAIPENAAIETATSVLSKDGFLVITVSKKESYMNKDNEILVQQQPYGIDMQENKLDTNKNVPEENNISQSTESVNNIGVSNDFLSYLHNDMLPECTTSMASNENSSTKSESINDKSTKLTSVEQENIEHEQSCSQNKSESIKASACKYFAAADCDNDVAECENDVAECENDVVRNINCEDNIDNTDLCQNDAEHLPWCDNPAVHFINLQILENDYLSDEYDLSGMKTDILVAVREFLLAKGINISQDDDELTSYRIFCKQNLNKSEMALAVPTKDETHYKFVIDVHEVSDKESIKVMVINNNELTIKGQLTKKLEQSKSNQEFGKCFVLSDDADCDRASSFVSEDGFLFITIPKKYSKLDESRELNTNVKRPGIIHINKDRIEGDSTSVHTGNDVELEETSKSTYQISNISRKINELEESLNHSHSVDMESTNVKVCQEETKPQVFGLKCSQSKELSQEELPLTEMDLVENMKGNEANEDAGITKRNELNVQYKTSNADDMAGQRELFFEKKSNMSDDEHETSEVKHHTKMFEGQNGNYSQTGNQIDYECDTSNEQKTYLEIKKIGCFFEDPEIEYLKSPLVKSIRNLIKSKNSESTLTEEELAHYRSIINQNHVNEQVTPTLDFEDDSHYCLILDIQDVTDDQCSQVVIVNEKEIRVEYQINMKKEDSEYIQRFSKSFVFSDDAAQDKVSSFLSQEGFLSIIIPKKVLQSSSLIDEILNDEEVAADDTVDHNKKFSDTYITNQMNDGVIHNMMDCNNGKFSAEQSGQFTCAQDNSQTIKTSGCYPHLETRETKRHSINAQDKCETLSISRNIKSDEDLLKTTSITDSRTTGESSYSDASVSVLVQERGNFADDEFFEGFHSQFMDALKETLFKYNQQSCQINDDIESYKLLVQNHTIQDEHRLSESYEDGTYFKIFIDVSEYVEEKEISVRISADNEILIEGIQDEMGDEEKISRLNIKSFVLPNKFDTESAVCGLSSDGFLSIIFTHKFEINNGFPEVSTTELQHCSSFTSIGCSKMQRRNDEDVNGWVLPISWKGSFFKDSSFQEIYHHFQSFMERLVRESKEENKGHSLCDIDFLRQLRHNNQELSNEPFYMENNQHIYKMALDVEGFIILSVDDKKNIIIEEKRGEKLGISSPASLSSSQNYSKRIFQLPEEVELNDISASLSLDGILFIVAAKKNVSS